MEPTWAYIKRVTDEQKHYIYIRAFYSEIENKIISLLSVILSSDFLHHHINWSLGTVPESTQECLSDQGTIKGIQNNERIQINLTS